MREMVEAAVYKADNGFNPGYLHFLEEKMMASCPSSGFKAKPHKDGFGYDNGTNTIVASDDVWVEYIKNFPEAGKWRGKRFYYYDECCYIFGNDRATGEDVCSADDYLDPADTSIL
ncbi:hypothetical protein Sjap_024555 [Stephania japonica]|uniref:Uncharacterized protein n=1 Tax=Stephania japonica TaxID=461633 RepID=A0AAP0HJY8_9MAGN